MKRLLSYPPKSLSLTKLESVEEFRLPTAGNFTRLHSGAWDEYQLDLDGDLNFSDTDELDELRTHSLVDEITGSPVVHVG